MAEESGASAEEGRSSASGCLSRDGDDEDQPLRIQMQVKDLDLVELRRRAAQIPKVQEESFLEWENNPCWMLLMNVSLALLNVVTIAGAYFFLLSHGINVTPRCYIYHEEGSGVIPHDHDSKTWEEWSCNICTTCFWTYPLIGMMVTVWIFRKNLLDARLYYECLCNGLLLDYRNMQCIYSPMFWLLLLYGVLAAGSLIYMKSASAASNLSYRELIYGLLAYMAPCAAFVFVLITQWSVEWNTVPLIKYCERDHAGALQLLGRSQVVRETRFLEAFEAAEDLLRRYQRENDVELVELNTSELVLLVLDMVNKRARAPFIRFWCFRSYWVQRVLLSEHLHDVRSSHFRIVIRLYQVFMCFAAILFVWSFLHTAQTLLILQKVLHEKLPLGPSPHWLVDQLG